MYKICVIGDHESVMMYNSIGLNVFPVSSEVEASIVLSKVLQEDYSIILISQYYIGLSEDLAKKHNIGLMPTFVPINPDNDMFNIKVAN